MTIRVRRATEADLDAIGDIHYRGRIRAYAGVVPAADLHAAPAAAMTLWWRERWRYESDTHRMSVAVIDGHPVGFTYVGPTEVPAEPELCAIFVEPRSQGTGVGRALMEPALRQLRELALGPDARAVLWVLTGNERARRFYEAAGWIADGARRDAPIGITLVPQLRYSRILR